jgi:hypothetical protein
MNCSPHSCTLREWQSRVKPLESLLFNCSEYHTKNDIWVPFSIGMSVHLLNYKKPFEPTQIGSHDKRVLMSINPNTDKRRRPTGINRRSILKILEEKGVPNQVLDYSEYIETLSSYKFIISPEGNGIDCHRHYEALIAGAIPIVESNDKIKEKYKGCPILYTTDYSEITPAYLEKQYSKMLDTNYDFGCLMMDTHTSETQKKIKNNGNFWGQYIYKKNWYEE